MPKKNAIAIVAVVIAVWVVAGILFVLDVPLFVQAASWVTGIGAIVGGLFYTLAVTGWRSLARAYPLRKPYTGDWHACANAHMASVSVDHAEYPRSKTRYAGVLRVGVTDQSLYLSTILTPIPLVGRLFPMVQIPWPDVVTARTYQAGGWISTGDEGAGALRSTSDPKYTGVFVELQVGYPPVFLQLPATVLGPGIASLPAAIA